MPSQAPIPPGVYIAKRGPDGAAIVVTPDRRFVHRCADGIEIPLSDVNHNTLEGWARQFYSSGDWIRIDRFWPTEDKR